MNIRDDIKQLKTSDRDLRKFGLMVGGVLITLGVLFVFRHKARTPYFVWPGAVLVLFGGILPRALKWIYIAWMSVAFVLGFVMAHVILTILFYLVIAPIGLLARLAGKDFLSLKLGREAKSYWIPRESKPKSTADYERQF
jgi:Saxitoxin biosynthesis operon protein SxtJ